MNEYLVLPSFPSTEYNALYSLCRRTIKQAIADNEKLTRAELMNQPIVKTTMGFVADQLFGVFDSPALYIDSHIESEYLSQSHWLLQDAISIAAGIEPFHFQLTPHRYTEQAHAQRNAMLGWVTRAIEQGDLYVCDVTGTAHINAHDFCAWALKTDEVADTATSLFTLVTKQ